MDKTIITIPTIHVPNILEDVCKNIIKYEEKDVSIIVIGDKKTPKETKDYCHNIEKEFGVGIRYLGIEEQEEVFKSYKELLGLFPYNTPDRVMLGGVLAYMLGCERIIALDDDNFPTEDNFVGSHSITGTKTELQLIKNDTGWFNIHSALIEKNNIPFYPRGFPWGQRKKESDRAIKYFEGRKVVVNQGLVLEDSDIDAISRLFYPINAIGMKQEFNYRNGLYPGTWSPFNYQNTCLSREIIPIYYRPISTKRNADIWTAYLINKLAEHFGDVIAFGQPLVKQIRNEHNLWDDLNLELENNIATDLFVSVLREAKLTEDTYLKALGELLSKVKNTESKMINDYFKEYHNWYEIISKIVWSQK